jgi:hypothetical protein
MHATVSNITYTTSLVHTLSSRNLSLLKGAYKSYVAVKNKIFKKKKVCMRISVAVKIHTKLKMFFWNNVRVAILFVKIFIGYINVMSLNNLFTTFNGC